MRSSLMTRLMAGQSRLSLQIISAELSYGGRVIIFVIPHLIFLILVRMSRPLSEMVMQACVSSFGSSLRPHFPKASGVRSRTLLSSRHQSSKSTLDEIQSKKQAFELKYAAQLTAKLQE